MKVGGNFRMLKNFYHQVVRLAFKLVNRRSQRKSYNWAHFIRFILFNPLPKPKIYHSRLQPEPVRMCFRSRMREIFKSGSARGSSNLGAITSKKRCAMGSTRHYMVLCISFRNAEADFYHIF